MANSADLRHGMYGHGNGICHEGTAGKCNIGRRNSSALSVQSWFRRICPVHSASNQYQSVVANILDNCDYVNCHVMSCHVLQSRNSLLETCPQGQDIWHSYHVTLHVWEGHKLLVVSRFFIPLPYVKAVPVPMLYRA